MGVRGQLLLFCGFCSAKDGWSGGNVAVSRDICFKGGRGDQTERGRRDEYGGNGSSWRGVGVLTVFRAFFVPRRAEMGVRCMDC